MQAMNHYYIFVWLDHLVFLGSFNCFQSYSVFLDSVDNSNNNKSSTNQYCQRTMTYVEIVTFLSKTLCPSIEKKIILIFMPYKQLLMIIE